jgi:hypothetical protein
MGARPLGNGVGATCRSSEPGAPSRDADHRRELLIGAVRCTPRADIRGRTLARRLRAMKRLVHCGKIVRASAVSDEPPDRSSMLGAGAVHHVKTDRRGLLCTKQS